MFPLPVLVKSVGKYKIWLKYADKTEGVVDLSSLAGKGVFEIWENGSCFENVFIDPISNAIAWNEELDLCPDNLYLEIKGVSFEFWKKNELADASN
jgi:hypothetical protein